MFSLAEKQAAYSGGGDKTQELGSLGLSVDDFKSVLATLKTRSGCLFLADPARPLRGLITDRTTQNSLLGLLGPKKKIEFGSASTGSETKKSSSRNNLKNKIDAEEAAIKTVFEIMASTSPSKDNPLKDDGVVISANPWSAPSEKQLEYLFREGVCLDVIYNNVKNGRKLDGEDTGVCPFVLTVRFEIRILQCLLLNFSWFGNRLYKVMKELNVESRASSTSVVFSDSLLNYGWANMLVKHCIKQDNVPAALQFMKTEYSTVYDKVENSGMKPTYFVVEFEMVDNAIGLADSDMEHQGTACVEWKCFNSIKKNAGEEFGNKQRGYGTYNMLFGESSETAAESEIEDTSVNNAGTAVTVAASEIFDSAVDNSSWMKSIMEVDSGRSTAELTKYEKFRSGISTVTVNQSSAVSLTAMPKGNESKVLVDSMIKFIDESVKAIDDPYMYSDDCVFSKDQGENYESHKDVYLAAICSNPSSIYRILCQLFTNLLLPRLRNPVRETRQIYSQLIETGKTKMMTEYGCGDVQYGTPQFAKGKMKISSGKWCECKKLCKEPRCFDSIRLVNTLKNGGSNPDPIEKRYHNSHRSNAYDFRFLDKIEEQARKLSNKKKSAEEEYTMNHDFLAQDRKAFDLLSKCFPSAGLHHIYCPDVLMVHRGNNYNIDLKNNKLDCITEINQSNQSEEITSSQTVNAKEALITITGNKLRKGTDIMEQMKSSGLSLREFSNKICRVVRNLNELTNTLCNISASLDHVEAVKAVLAYIRMVMPTLETMLSIVNIEELQKPFDALKTCMSETGNNNKSAEKKFLKAAFALFRTIVKFLLRNYNASVAAAINRRGYLCNTATLTGYRFKSDGNVIYYHESIAAVSSCIAYADYFSSRSDTDGGNSDENGITYIDGTVASLMGDLLDDADNSFCSGKKKNSGGDSETFIKMYADELLGADNDKDEDKEENENEDKEEKNENEEKEENAIFQIKVWTTNRNKEGKTREYDKEQEKEESEEEGKTTDYEEESVPRSPQRMKRSLNGGNQNEDLAGKRCKIEEEEQIF